MIIRVLCCSFRSFLLVLLICTFLLSYSLLQAFAQGDPAAGVQLFSTNDFGVFYRPLGKPRLRREQAAKHD
jgi:hypothetical protein